MKKRTSFLMLLTAAALLVFQIFMNVREGESGEGFRLAAYSVTLVTVVSVICRLMARQPAKTEGKMACTADINPDSGDEDNATYSSLLVVWAMLSVIFICMMLPAAREWIVKIRPEKEYLFPLWILGIFPFFVSWISERMIREKEKKRREIYTASIVLVSQIGFFVFQRMPFEYFTTMGLMYVSTFWIMRRIINHRNPDNKERFPYTVLIIATAVSTLIYSEFNVYILGDSYDSMLWTGISRSRLRMGLLKPLLTNAHIIKAFDFDIRQLNDGIQSYLGSFKENIEAYPVRLILYRYGWAPAILYLVLIGLFLFYCVRTVINIKICDSRYGLIYAVAVVFLAFQICIATMGSFGVMEHYMSMPFSDTLSCTQDSIILAVLLDGSVRRTRHQTVIKELV